MKRRALMVLVFVAALAALVLWNPMERGRGGVSEVERVGGASGQRAGAAGGVGGGGAALKDGPAARGDGGARAERAWWDVARAGDDDASAPLPVRKVRTPSGEVRFVSAIVPMEILDSDPDIGLGAGDGAAGEMGEASDLDDDHPGSYWSNLGYTSIRAVLADLGVHADMAWVDGASGQMSVSQILVPGVGGAGGVRERLIVLSPESTPGDADGDGTASGLDVARFLKVYAAKSIEADVNDDGVVDQRDLVRFLREWSEGSG